MKYDYCVFIARLQPPHKAHIKIINHALMIAEKVIVVFGSHRSAPNIKNPWDDNERSQLLMFSIDEDDRHRIIPISVRDYPYNNQIWLAEVQNKVRSVMGVPAAGWSDYKIGDTPLKVALIGFKKDDSSFYLDMFPQWDYVDTGFLVKGVSATKIRQFYFLEDIADELPESTRLFLKSSSDANKWRTYLPEPVLTYLDEFKQTDRFKRLQGDYKYLVNYKASWEKTPFPVTFTTVDSIVIKSGHILLVKRKVNPGKGLFALPGGFINQHEWIFDAAVRELKEETKIRLKDGWKEELEEWRKLLKGEKVFDHPGRSLRGRVVTHCYFFELPSIGELPEVKGSDDAELAVWMPIGDLTLHENLFYEDHLSIVQHFLWKL